MVKELEDMVAAGLIEPLHHEEGHAEYHIPRLRHKEETWTGKQTITYTLAVDDNAEPGGRYVIDSDSDDSGGDCMLATDDLAEVRSWIEGMLAG